MTEPLPETGQIELDEPLIHSTSGAPLADGHWMRLLWDVDTTVEPVVICSHCGKAIYDRDRNASLMTWVETGRVVPVEEALSPQAWCLDCFATSSLVWPRMLNWWGLLNGGPLPLLELQEAMEVEQIETLVVASASAASQPEVIESPPAPPESPPPPEEPA